jgi:hypothetical protein
MGASGSTSKKPSAASSTSKPPDPLVLFVDRSLGKKIVPDALRQAGAHVEAHDDHFLPDALDEHWLRDVGAKGWVVLTKDRRIRYRAPALTAIGAAGARVFVLTAGDLRGHEMAALFVNALPKMARFVVRHPAPFISRVSKSGSVSMLLAARQLQQPAP